MTPSQSSEIGSRPLVTLLTDYGTRDIYVGLLHGVIARLCPEAHVIDLGHGVARGDVVAGALALADALPYLPVATHVAVVDPGVGSERRAVALVCADGRTLVGPDNGLLSLAVDAAGGVGVAVEISQSPWRLEPLSATFHGRDLFAPVAARLAGGEPLETAGALLDPATLTQLELPEVPVSDGTLQARVTAVDAFGNIALLATAADARRAGLRLGQQLTADGVPAHYRRTFADVDAGELLLHEDSTGRLALAVNGGSAAIRLGVTVADRVRIGVAEHLQVLR